VTTPDEPQLPANIDAHRKSLLQVFRIEQICPIGINKINGLWERRKGLVAPSQPWSG
jgi:hypothetical protein